MPVNVCPHGALPRKCKIYGEDGEIPRASWFWCEPCGDQFFNLKELGFCPSVDDEVSELLREYHEEYVVPEHGQMIQFGKEST